MSYLLNKSDGSLLVELFDGTADGPQVNDATAHSSINLIGKNYPGYGELQNENFVHLLENFAKITAPSHPITGQLWYDTANKRLNVYDGSAFGLVTTAAFAISATAPTGANTGDSWWDTVNDQYKTYSGTSWVTVGPSYSKLDGKSGAIVETISDGTTNHTVVKLYSNNNLIGIVSYEGFTPVPAITGFPTIQPGINLNTTNSGRYNGTATNATNLGGVVSTSYARKDLTSVETFASNVNVGNGSLTLTSNPVTGAANITNVRSGGDLNLYTNIGGTLTCSVCINGTTGEVQVASAPTTNMGVANKGYVDLRVSTQLNGFAPLNSPAFTGSPTATAPAGADKSTRIATTAWTKDAIKSATDALWQGSQKFVSAGTPEPTSGSVGDFWFQI